MMAWTGKVVMETEEWPKSGFVLEVELTRAAKGWD